jgi:hypothetical protein
MHPSMLDFIAWQTSIFRWPDELVFCKNSAIILNYLSEKSTRAGYLNLICGNEVLPSVKSKLQRHRPC